MLKDSQAMLDKTCAGVLNYVVEFPALVRMSSWLCLDETSLNLLRDTMLNTEESCEIWHPSGRPEGDDMRSTFFIKWA